MTRVLIVEAEPWLSDHYGHILEGDGHAVVHASDGHTAMDLIDGEPPDVIVLGLLLHGPSGIALLHELQSYTDTAKIPVIVCTGLGDIKLSDLRPYGVKRLVNSATMQPDDLVVAVRSVLT
jgi:DNA-binding response OmpR family regulator